MSVEKGHERKEVRSIEKRITKEEEFPVELEKRLEAILSAFNASPKAATLLLLSESLIDPDSLATRFSQLMLDSQMAKTNKITASYYCHSSLCPVGLVAKETTIDYFGLEKLAGFTLTEAGKKYGQPIAAFCLNFEAEYNFSLFPIFGSTQTVGSHRSPYHRTLILKSLVSGQKRQADICEETGIPKNTITNSLVALKKAGVIEYTAVTLHTGKVQVEYQLSCEIKLSEVKTVHDYKTLTKQIGRICQKLAKNAQPITQSNVYNLLPDKIKQKLKAGKLKERAVRIRILYILSGLEKQGFLKRKLFKGAEFLSLAKLTEKGKLVVEEFLLSLEDALLNGPTLAKFAQEVLPQVLANLAKFGVKSAELYYPHSLGFKKKESAENQAKLYSLLSPVIGKTCQELAEQLELNDMTIYYYLKSLIAQKKVVREKIKGVYYYKLAPNLV